MLTLTRLRRAPPPKNANPQLLALLYKLDITKGATMEAGKGGVANIEMLKFVNDWPRIDTAPTTLTRSGKAVLLL